jgi:hypothetical protein
MRDGENRQQRRNRHEGRQQDLDELPAVAVLGSIIRWCIPTGRLKTRNKNEGQPSHRVAVERPPAARGTIV